MASDLTNEGTTRRTRLVALLLAVPLLVGGILGTMRDRNEKLRSDLFRSLSTEATQESARLSDYFARARDVLLVAAQNPALRDFFDLPGDNAYRIAAGGKVVDDVNAALQYIHQLYSDSIGEICYIDRGGAEIARLVHEVAAQPDELAHDESGNAFFAATIGLPPGEVYQAAPYMSPDTHSWVISNSTLIAGVNGSVPALLHFEVSLDSFRQSLGKGRSGTVTRVFDGRTGAVLIDSRFPQRDGAPVGEPGDRTFEALLPGLGRAGNLTLGSEQVSYVRVETSGNNANDWVVAVSAPTADSGWRSGISGTTLLTFLAAVVLIGASLVSARFHRKRLETMALTDSLTGLANRTLFQDRARQALALGARTGAHTAVLMIDLDRFKEVNDSLGHHVGDVLLKAIGPRLEPVLRPSDTLARFGGDEFAILLPSVAGPAAAGMVADRVLEAFVEPFVLDGLEVAIEASIGVALGPDDGDDVELLIQRADLSMYAAKRGRLGAVVFDAHLDVHKPEKLSMFGQLRKAIDERQLVLHYQPKVDLADQAIRGVEALVRWPRTDGTITPPMEFIPLAEQTTLIKPLTAFVLNEALAQCRRWLDDGRTVSVAVNVSTRSLLDREFPRFVANVLTARGVPAQLLELEITESTIMADPDCAREVLDELHTMGVKLSIDDFGTGYSSLAYLKSLPIDTLKIDRSFIMNLRTDHNDAVITQSMISLAKNLGLRVIAEGVEDASTAALLADSGCDSGQGYYWHKPVPADHLTALLSASKAITDGNRART